MSYEARREPQDDKEAEKAQKKAESDAANQKAVQVAADAASKSGNAYAAAIGKGIQTADRVTGGKASELGGKELTRLNNSVPLGKAVQGITNATANNDMADKAYDAYSMKNSKGASAAEKAKDGADKAVEGAEKAKDGADKINAQGKKELPNQVKNNQNQVGGEQDSLPSSDGQNDNQNKGASEPPKDEKVIDKVADGIDSATEKSEKFGKGLFAFVNFGPIAVVMIPFLLIAVFIMGVVLLTVITTFSDYEDAFGISQLTTGDTGGMNGTVSNTSQKKFYERIIEVQNEFQSKGKTVDPLMIVSVYHALSTYKASISYNSMTKYKITQIADAMFDGNVYSEETFRANLKSKIIPIYMPFANKEKKEAIVTEVFEYIDRYYALIGKKKDNCSSLGNCTYNIKGFYISGSNYKKEINVNNLYVRLMQCGSYNGHNAGGTWGEPLEDEELVPFEKYVLGVAYQEIGTGVSEDAFKAQLIASRSYILARPTQMGSSTKWRKLEKESSGKWVLQVASCTADQVYCDPDKGCSAVNGDAQWKQVHSGTSHGTAIKGPLAEDSKYRQYASDVQGEVLVNDQGYIVLTNYESAETNSFASMGNSGYDYKQILIQEYSQKYPGAGELSIQKNDCGRCASTGNYTKWRQDQGEWVNISLGKSQNTIGTAGCLVTSLAMQVAKSGVQTNVSSLNPGTFVEYLNGKNVFDEYGNFTDYTAVSYVAPTFKYQNTVDVSGMSKEDKLNTIKNIVSSGAYAIAEVKGKVIGEHWVAIDSVSGDTIKMMDPGSDATDMWKEYNWDNTSTIVYYKVG